MDTHTGIVTTYNESRGFGFIREISNDESARFAEQYFHVSSVTQRLALKAGDYVYFQIGTARRRSNGTEAFDVRLTTANEYVPSEATPPPSDKTVAPLTPSSVRKDEKDGQ